MGRRPSKTKSDKPPAARDHHRRPRRNTAILVCGLLLLAVLVVFGPVVGHGFVNYDDDLYVSENPHVTRGLSAEGIRWAFTATRSSNWHPLTWLSHMLDCQLCALNASGHHLTNVMLHAATTILLFSTLWRISGDLWPSAFVAAVFAAHPLRVESVAWIAERKDVLSGLCFASVLAAYAEYVRYPFSPVRYLTVMALLALGLMAKPMLVTLPFVLLLLDYWPLRRAAPPLSTIHFDSSGSQAPAWEPSGSVPRLEHGREWQNARKNWRLLVEKLPLLLLSTASCVVTPLVQTDAVQSIERYSVGARAGNALVSYAAYMAQLFYPSGLAVFYPHPGSDLPLGQVLAALLLLILMCIGAVVWRAKYPFLLVGWLWYLGMLVPVIGLVQVGGQSMADRYTYLPQIGLVVAVAWGAERVFASWRPPVPSLMPPLAFTLVAAILLGCAWRQTSYWCNAETLWTRALDCTSQNGTAHANLGAALDDQGRVDEAITQYQEAIRIRTGDVMALNNLGAARAKQARFDEAAVYCRKAIGIRPNYAEAHANLGIALYYQGHADEAIQHFHEAIRLKPEYTEAHIGLGILLAAQGNLDEAIACFERALELKPDSVKAHGNLGGALAKQGRFGEAITHYQRVLEIKPDHAEARRTLNALLRSQGGIHRP